MTVMIILLVLIMDATFLISLYAECSLRLIESVCRPGNLVGLTSVVLLHSQHKCCYVILTVIIECHEIGSPPPQKILFYIYWL